MTHQAFVVIQWAYVYKTTDMWGLPQGRPSVNGGGLLQVRSVLGDT